MNSGRGRDCEYSAIFYSEKELSEIKDRIKRRRKTKKIESSQSTANVGATIGEGPGSTRKILLTAYDDNDMKHSPDNPSQSPSHS